MKFAVPLAIGLGMAGAVVSLFSGGLMDLLDNPATSIMLTVLVFGAIAWVCVGLRRELSFAGRAWRALVFALVAILFYAATFITIAALVISTIQM